MYKHKPKQFLQQLTVVFLTFVFYTTTAFAQTGTISGHIFDENGTPLEAVQIIDSIQQKVSISDARGFYSLEIPANIETTILYKYVGYETQKKEFLLKKGEKTKQDIQLAAGVTLIPELEIKGNRLNTGNMVKIDPKLLSKLPNPSGNIEKILVITQPGVFSNNELSAQYSVRGGSFDENLIYVNDFEITRPFLVRSGQQEGLSFINPDMIGALSFSSGGFEAKYGDKMASVLDVTYKVPQKRAGSVSVGLLGFSAHLEGARADTSTTFIVGVRQKSNRYLLDALPTQGNYQPVFWDFQTFVTHRLNKQWQLQGIGNLAINKYRFLPDKVEIAFGTVTDAKQLRIAFDGQEEDRYLSGMGGISAIYAAPNNKLVLKFLSSYYRARENENFDLIGSYYIGEIENDLGKEEFGDVVSEFGVGTYHDFARNELNANIAQIGHRGWYNYNNHLFSWGFNIQNERIDDKLNEWQRVDSAGYNLPFSESTITLKKVLKAKADLNSMRYTAFVQDGWEISKRAYFTSGLRFHYWDLNQDFFVSPRFQFAYKVNERISPQDKGLDLRFSAGLYYQSPFFREMRNPQGELNTQLRAQKSAHFVLGSDYEFLAWGSPFKFTTEIYYKYFWDVVTYDLDNVLIRYAGENNAKAYATGIDFRLNGEFVPGAESWVSFSLLKTEENLNNDFYYRYFNEAGEEVFVNYNSPDEFADTTLVNIGYVPRPTDQRFSFSIFFQDYLPNNENFKVNLSLLVGGPLPQSPPNAARYRNAFRTPIYARTDIGFSVMLFERGKRELREQSLLHNISSTWLDLEVFNLLGNPNTISYSWVDDYQGRIFAVPNRLTARRINLKLRVNF
ncbi:MAG: TonB-dependent receptor [Chitinophagales bacterium]|nr:carboxypeptidase-like regulatory domain-containing protein [Bacteroidota bacterium]MCB9043511.1 carboxypeptidase-like regulatory domain-containing protein [Chitinophagales bacterium]